MLMFQHRLQVQWFRKLHINAPQRIESEDLEGWEFVIQSSSKLLKKENVNFHVLPVMEKVKFSVIPM